jgi:alkylresorcinol/alkylpyrone synthase
MVRAVVVLGVGQAFPPHRVSQDHVIRVLSDLWAEGGRAPEAVARMHRATGVRTRNLVWPMEAYTAPRTFTETNDTFIQTGTQLGAEALRDAFARTGLDPYDVDHLFVVSSTGVATPSLDARLVNRVGLRLDVKRTPIAGLGCIGGAAGIARAADYVRAFPDEVAAVVAVELCTLTFQRDDTTVANVIATGLFGDGAAAAIVAGERRTAMRGPGPLPSVLGSASVLLADSEDVVGWRVTDSGFNLVLRSDLPDAARDVLGPSLDGFLARHGAARRDVGVWIVHPGGPKLLQAVAETLALPAGALDRSVESLARLGNMSSVSVLCILRDVLDAEPAAGTLGLVLGMGPGFGAEMVLLRWD